ADPPAQSTTQSTTQPTAQPPALLAPVTKGDRLAYIDTLRGFALLGILMPNILTFALPIDTRSQKPVLSETPANLAALWTHDIVFFGKFMFLFAMLFGAGVTIWDRKLAGKPLSHGTGRWYARCGWLAAFGLAHGWLFWFGDILLLYGLAGMGLVWWVRRLPWQVLVPGGVAVYAVGSGVMLLLAWALSMAPEEQMSQQQAQQDAWFSADQQIAAYTGSWLDALGMRAVMLFQMYLLIPFVMIWWATGLMMLGMGLAKSSFLRGEAPAWVYATVATLGLAIGLGVTIPWRAYVNAPDTDMARGLMWVGSAQFVGMPIGLAYASILALVVKLAASNAVARAISGGLGNVGRMALSNYFSHTIICCTVFYGYAFGYYGRIEFPQLWLIIAAIWVFNFAFSAIWLRYFRFGPAEWLWRCLTYWKLQPIRKPATQSVPAAA
ncbi:MAG: DUF418 domain-containing protein, partial [Planctomycetota bacterium]